MKKDAVGEHYIESVVNGLTKWHLRNFGQIVD